MGGPVFALGPLVVVALLVVIGIAGLVWSMARNRSRYDTPGETVNPADQVHLRPLIRARERLDDLLAKHGNDPNIKVIGSEARKEVDELIKHTEDMLRSELSGHRSDLKSQLAEVRGEVESLVSDLEQSAVETQVDDASTTLRESLSRIQSLSASLDEAEQLTDRNL
ncbi:MAG: hypothetical protein IT363_01000 [Methanoregulaceae archaeon]|nr:hypothetical protein [Methanoregulaceae archaeon]